MTASKKDRQAKRVELKKKHRTSPILKREEVSQETHKQILIVSEGKNTEPSYFEQFKEPGVTIVPVGLGKSTGTLVKAVASVIEQKQKTLNGKKFDEVWVVFDKDDFPDFTRAIDQAESKGYRVAYSNQAIEYWFLLHFMDHQGGAMDRKDYVLKFNSLLEKIDTKKTLKYDGTSKNISEEVFNVLYKNIQLAYDRAERIYQKKMEQGNPTSESVTTIHKLIHSIKGITTSSMKASQAKKIESMRKARIID